jgi:hypothetical protein
LNEGWGWERRGRIEEMRGIWEDFDNDGCEELIIPFALLWYACLLYS